MSEIASLKTSDLAQPLRFAGLCGVYAPDPSVAIYATSSTTRNTNDYGPMIQFEGSIKYVTASGINFPADQVCLMSRNVCYDGIVRTTEPPAFLKREDSVFLGRYALPSGMIKTKLHEAGTPRRRIKVDESAYVLICAYPIADALLPVSTDSSIIEALNRAYRTSISRHKYRLAVRHILAIPHLACSADSAVLLFPEYNSFVRRWRFISPPRLDLYVLASRRRSRTKKSAKYTGEYHVLDVEIERLRRVSHF